MNCPGCHAVIGRFRTVADGGEHVDSITCRHTGVTYVLPQSIPQRSTPTAKSSKRRKSKRPSVIAQRRAEAAARDATMSKSKQRKAQRQRRLAEALAA
jgi:hypothetical protein